MEISAKKAIAYSQGLLTGYSQVYFSRQWVTGALFMAATFIVPAQGIVGLAGLVLSVFAARLLSMPREQIIDGYFALNGVLVGLVLGLTYEINVSLVLLLSVVSFLGVLVASCVRTLFDRYLGVPPLTAPFVLTSWLALAAGERYTGLAHAQGSWTSADISGFVAQSLNYVLSSFGATFFQPNVVSGTLIVTGILFFSRFAFVLAIIGLVSGTFFHTLLAGNPTDLHGMWIGFNFALTAVAVGGIWTTPSIISLGLAVLGAVCCAFVAEAVLFCLKPFGLPPLALPFLVTTTIVLYAVKQTPYWGVLTPAFSGAASPEIHLKSVKARRARQLVSEFPVFDLPFRGEWQITQGVNGEYTHRGLWAHAWDFEVTQSDGRKFRTHGESPSDFLAYKLPVLSPASGVVTKVVDSVEDNEIGRINPRTNWGNTVVIWHYGSVYTALCHLAPGETMVRVGQQVETGEIIAKVGSSGHSPVPHLHFQAQSGPEVGAPTATSQFQHFLVQENGGWRYITTGVPEQGQTVKNLQPDPRRFEAASFPMGNSWGFLVKTEQGECEEIWESEIDIQGVRFLRCREPQASLRYHVDEKALLLLDYYGPPETALSWFFLGVSRMPFTKANVFWRDEPAPDLLLTAPGRTLFNLLEPLAPMARLRTESRFASLDGESLAVETIIRMTGPLLRCSVSLKLTTLFDQNSGPLSLVVNRNDKTIFEIRRLDKGPIGTALPCVI